MRRVLVTGVTGFAGSHLVDYLLERGDCEIHGILRWRSPTENIEHFMSRISLLECDLRDASSTRDTLEKLSDDLVERTVEICRQALEDARLHIDEIEDVILVGGMTRMPAVQSAVAFSSHEWITRVDVPTAVVVTTADQLVPPSRQRRLASAIPHAAVFDMFGDHAVSLTNPAAFARVLITRGFYAS